MYAFRTSNLGFTGPVLVENTAKWPHLRLGVRRAVWGGVVGAAVMIIASGSAAAQSAGGSVRATAEVIRPAAGASALQRGKGLIVDWERARGATVRASIGVATLSVARRPGGPAGVPRAAVLSVQFLRN